MARNGPLDSQHATKTLNEEVLTPSVDSSEVRETQVQREDSGSRTACSNSLQTTSDWSADPRDGGSISDSVLMEDKYAVQNKKTTASDLRSGLSGQDANDCGDAATTLISALSTNPVHVVSDISEQVDAVSDISEPLLQVDDHASQSRGSWTIQASKRRRTTHDKTVTICLFIG